MAYTDDWESLMNGVFGAGGKLKFGGAQPQPEKPQPEIPAGSGLPNLNAALLEQQKQLDELLKQQNARLKAQDAGVQTALEDSRQMLRDMEADGLLAKGTADVTAERFGSFEGRNFIEMEKDPEYQAWVKANCESPCPDGERKTDFSDRICRTVAELIDKALAAGEERLVILAHGGTQMAAMERFAVPHRDYNAWCGPNAAGIDLDAKDWTEKHLLYLVKTVQYTKESRA